MVVHRPFPGAGPKRVVVLGGAGGIGAGGVRALAAGGHPTVVIDRVVVEAGLPTTASLVADALDDRAVATAIESAVSHLGGLDAAWSHAGIQLLGTVESMSLDDLDWSYRMNVRAHAVFARAVLPHLRTAGGGSLLFTSSGAGIVVDRAAVPYGTMKSALITMARSLALDHASDGIRVNALCPGWVDTSFNAPAYDALGGYEAFLAQVPDLIPIGRVAGPDEIGRLAAWLLTAPEASYITGQPIVVDGGDSLHYGAR
jgi:NAD(P)-dependent dehydrogenase (short-subunit alcohol dehydrogenase family)